MDTEIREVIAEIKKVERDIEIAEVNIRKFEAEIDRFGEQATEDDRRYLRRKEEQLRTEKEQLRRKEHQLRDERKLQLQLKIKEGEKEQLQPNPEAPPSNKPKPSQPIEEVVAAQVRYFETLLEPPADLPRTPTELEKFLAEVPVKLPLADEAMYQEVGEHTFLTQEFTKEAGRLPALVASTLRTMESKGLNEATSSAKLYHVTGVFIEQLNKLAPLSRMLHNVLVTLDSANPKSPQTASQPPERLARPDMQLFVKGCLILRWENKVEYRFLRLAEAENCKKLKSWSPLFYGRLPYVIGGCCAGNQFQWLMLKPNAKGDIESDVISPEYDLNSLKDLTAFLHSNVRMHCLLQKLQECLGSIKLTLYTPEDRGNE